MNHKLLLGSTSQSRQELLQQANIPFTCVGQSADESQCDWGLPLQKLVESIAVYKMDHLVLPQGAQGQHCFVLTADTLSQDSQGRISGKPISHEDAVSKIRDARAGMETGTAFCLEKKHYKDGKWITEKRILRYASARYQFNVPEEWLERYFEQSRGKVCSGAIAIEGFGGMFLTAVDGSYTAIVGLPLSEVRRALEEIGFFN